MAEKSYLEEGLLILSCLSACLFFRHVPQGMETHFGWAQDVVGTTLNLYTISIQSGNIWDVSKISDTPKSSILIGFSIIFTIHFGVSLFLETPCWEVSTRRES